MIKNNVIQFKLNLYFELSKEIKLTTKMLDFPINF